MSASDEVFCEWVWDKSDLVKTSCAQVILCSGGGWKNCPGCGLRVKEIVDETADYAEEMERADRDEREAA